MEIDLTALEQIHTELEELHHRCERQLLRPGEIQSALIGLDQRIRILLPADSDLHRLFDRLMREATDWWHATASGYVDKQDCRHVGRRIAAVREVLSEVEPDFLRAEHLPRKQYYFQAGEVYRARQQFYRLLTSALQSIDIADPYLDSKVFDFIEALEPARHVRLLTGAAKTLFASQFHALKDESRRLEARSNDQNHDRFVIIDATEAWHLGASINGLGKKAFMINKVTEPDELSKLQADFKQWWSTGVAL